ncbi:MAG: hypothetical protein ACREDR_21965 [Blastocatellia bacterium]
MATITIPEETQTNVTHAFSLRDSAGVKLFLSENNFLYDLLIEAVSEINKRFPEPDLALEVVLDPDESDDAQLFLYVCTTLAPKDARSHLKEFDRGWWLPALPRTRGKLCISLEYL